MSSSVETEENCPCPHCGRQSCTVALSDCFGDVSETSRCADCGYVIVFEYGCGSLDDPAITANKLDGIIVVDDAFIPGSLAGAHSLVEMLRRQNVAITQCWHVDHVSGRIEPVIGDPQRAENYTDAMRHAGNLFARIHLQADLGEPHCIDIRLTYGHA